MACHGEYTYNNYTLLNPLLDLEDFQSASVHEYTHMVLSGRSCIGMMLYCLEKIKIPYRCTQDISRYKTITEFLNRHTNKVQEGLAVFVQSTVKLSSEGPEACSRFIDYLFCNNGAYYKYLEPLLFIIDIMKKESGREEILKTANIVFLLGIECMNGELYQEDPLHFITGKAVQKLISRPDFSKTYLPDNRFTKCLKAFRGKAESCKEIQEYIMPFLGEDVLNPSMSRSEERLNCIKEFIINIFGSSEHVMLYKNSLSKVNAVEVRMDEMYFQQLPAVFNEEEVLERSRKGSMAELQKAVREEYSMIMLQGTLEEALRYMYQRMGAETGFEYDKKYCSENELISHFDLKKKDILMVLGDVKQADELLLLPERRSVIVTSYKNYDFSVNEIRLHRDIWDEIFIYCDRTYSNARCYLDLWKEQDVYYRYMAYNNMIVLIVKITEKRFFLLPMTSIAAVEADADIRENRMNMQMCCEEADEGYDPYIVTGEDAREKIDTVVNCLFFITEGGKIV